MIINIHMRTAFEWHNLATLLTEWAETGPPNLQEGICPNLAHLRYGKGTILPEPDEYFQLWNKWPHWSGSIQFPVPHPDFPNDPKRASAHYSQTENCWEDRYGELRRDLCAYMASTIYEELARFHEKHP